MDHVDNFEELMTCLSLTQKRPLLIGIDGRPCSGKSTLADKLVDEIGADAIFLDDFFIPQAEWPKDIKPAFPFPFFLYQEFVQGVMVLSHGQIFRYGAFDWVTKGLGDERVIDPTNIIIVEGVSVLCKQLVSCFDYKIFVVSDRTNEFDAIAERENQEGLINWKQLYLPSVELYWKTKPWERADFLYAGRGVSEKSFIGRALKDEQ